MYTLCAIVVLNTTPVVPYELFVMQVTLNTESYGHGIEHKTSPVPEFIDPRFRENKPKTLVFSH
jgi:hypothetical protein